ncbi:hypothetical protein KC19_2G172900 [Ceratodon purpureus]|uniref:40S ribosomal protein S19 n=1 Tax=Ceratodon purpureus TaxID=3225 RepID=A0A8T0IUX8_CERPU|nr:hypothetical protein KC19_2G172900 [Ceratodon purpureus]
MPTTGTAGSVWRPAGTIGANWGQGEGGSVEGEWGVGRGLKAGGGRGRGSFPSASRVPIPPSQRACRAPVAGRDQSPTNCHGQDGQGCVVARVRAQLRRAPQALRQVEVPVWADLVKTATFKELAPYDADWYYIRAASMARKIYLSGGIEVGAFKKIYGGRKSNGVRPSHFAKSSGSIARHCLKQLEALNIVEKDPKG